MTTALVDPAKLIAYSATPTLPRDDRGRLLITGEAARELVRHVRTYVVDRHGKVETGWREAQGMSECRHGCKLYVRRRGFALQFQLYHSTSYGCLLGRMDDTRTVPVSVRQAIA